MTELLGRWHQCVETKDPSLIQNILHPRVVFKTPLYLKPRIGSDIVVAILASAISIFEDFKYDREWISADKLNFALEFEAKVHGKLIRGIDLIKFNDDGQIVEFEVMLRPIKQAVKFGELQAVGIPKQIAKLAKL